MDRRKVLTTQSPDTQIVTGYFLTCDACDRRATVRNVIGDQACPDHLLVLPTDVPIYHITDTRRPNQ